MSKISFHVIQAFFRTVILIKKKMNKYCAFAHALTLLLLADLLHQASDLDVLFPFFTSRGCCTAAFWENMFTINTSILSLSIRQPETQHVNLKYS